jgi:hypothetical protein
MQVLSAMAPTMAKREKEAAAKEQVTANQLERTQIVKGISTCRSDRGGRGGCGPARGKHTATALNPKTT